MTLQPFGVKVREKKRKWLTTSSIFNILLLLITLVSVSTTYYFSVQNQQQQNTLYSYTPFIFSNYSSSTLRNPFLSINDTYIYFEGLVNVDLKVVSPYDGMLSIDVKNLSFTNVNSSDNMVPYYFNMSLLKYSSASICGFNHYQYFISKKCIESNSRQIAGSSLRLFEFRSPSKCFQGCWSK